jgi:hypothetical protein
LCNTIKNPDLNIDLPEPEKLDFRNKEFNYDIYFKDKSFRLPQCKHERPFNDSTILKERVTDINGKSWKVERYEYKSCSECGHPLVAMDPLRGERVCECGMTNKRVMMIADTELKWQGSKDKLRDSKTSQTYEEEKFLEQFRRNNRKKNIITHAQKEMEKENKSTHIKVHPRTPIQEWRKAQYILTLGAISSQLLMNKSQKDRVKHIIEKHSLKTIHSRMDQRITIAGICRYILMKDGRGSELRYNRSAFKFAGLDETKYEVIRRNLDRLGIF